MDAIDGGLLTTQRTSAVTRRTTLRGFGGGLAAALAFRVSNRVRANGDDRIAAALFGAAPEDDPAAVVTAYLEAVAAHDLEGILALYADDAVHIALPTPDGSAGVCRGKEQFRMWHEQAAAQGYRAELVDGSLSVDGNQAAFAVRVSSAPWQELGVTDLTAQDAMVIIDGRIATHIESLAPDAVRQLTAARDGAA